ncbi:hypothetical protein PM082_008768 [Marasmius tenuissimus]|nr:hypothetical protein PM082_008768 [Marasmius tenuissimus]
MHRGSQPKKNLSTIPRMNINRGRDQIHGDSVEVNNIGGDLVQNFATRSLSSRITRKLWDAVAGVGASHLSQQQFDRGLECLEGTREEVLEAIYAWLMSEDGSSPIYWISGAAGVGKSAIAMTIAKSYEGKGLASSFFFFRPDPKRNNPSAFALSIAHDLKVRMPFAEGYITRRISKDPTILEATLEDQFRELVFEPCLRNRLLRRILHQLSFVPKEPRLVIIDGLDECSDENTQRRILSTILSSYKQSRHFPLRFLICSRPEAWIREAFNEEDLRRLTQHFQLDDEIFPDRDIERYYLREFRNIRESPQFARLPFPEVWPSPEDLVCLVDKSSGQFVYAVTAVKFVTLRCSNPLTQLRTILDYTPDNPPSRSSFAAIDTLYQMILSDHPDPEQLLPVLAAILILPPHGLSSPEFIELLLGLPTGEIDIILRPMHSILNIRNADVPITAYHASFIDFLYDKSRSQCFHIDKAAQRDFFARRWIQALEPRNQPRSSDDQTKCTLWDGWTDFCLRVERPSEGLLFDLRKMDILAVYISVVLIHHEREELSSIITGPLEAIISWLAPLDGSPPVQVIRHFQVILTQYKSLLTAKSDESIQGQLRGSPRHELATLYHLVLTAHPDPERLRSILSAILVLPPHLKPSPTYIGLLFGLPPGEVILALQGMRSVLDVRGCEDEIRVRHPSFTDYLVDQKQSHEFHIDIRAQRHFIARQWLDSVSAFKMQMYSFDELYGDSTNSFFTEWMGFCTTKFTKPTQHLMNGLRDIDFASVFFCKHFPKFTGRYPLPRWSDTFQALRAWMVKVNRGYNFPHSVQGLVEKLEKSPKSFHLEQSSEPLSDDDLVVAVLITIEWPGDNRLVSDATRNYQRQAPLRIRECYCNILLPESEFGDPAKHLAYQEACTRVAKVYITEIEVLAKTGHEYELADVFGSLVDSSLLQRCQINTELLLSLKNLFGSVRERQEMRFLYASAGGIRARLYDWIGTFPESFAQEAAGLKAQVNALPWKKWQFKI